MFGLSRKLFVGRGLVVGHVDECPPFRDAELIEDLLPDPAGFGDLTGISGGAMGGDKGGELGVHTETRNSKDLRVFDRVPVIFQQL